MTRKELPARAADIQRAIASATTCTPATVQSLRDFVLPLDPQDHPSVTQVHAQKDGIKGRRPPKPATVKSRKQPTVSVIETSDADNGQRLPQGRFKLATEVVNLTLRTLSEAGKTPPPLKKGPTLKRTSSDLCAKGALPSRNQIPLQPISVNGVIRDPAILGHLRRSSSNVSLRERSRGLRAQAECGRVAFAALRSLRGIKGTPPMPDLAIESGMSALIARFITLGFDDLALKEVFVLKRCLESLREPSSKSKTGSNMKSSNKEPYAPGPEKGRLSDLLSFGKISASGQCLNLIVTTQLHILRLIGSIGSRKDKESALPHLQLDVPYSPASQLLQQVEPESLESRTKVAHQLESLARILITLCNETPSTHDGNQSKKLDQLPGPVVFQYHVLALEIRAKWWALAKHEVDHVQEIIRPFFLCLTKLQRHSSLVQESIYLIAEQGFRTISTLSEDLQNQYQGELLCIYDTLADLAQRSNRNLEAIEWTNQWLRAAGKHGVSGAKMCTFMTRLAALQIKATPSSSRASLVPNLSAVLNSLDGNLQGDSAELDELLVAVARLRRSAFSIVQDAHCSEGTNYVPGDDEVISLCMMLVLHGIQFLLRYIGNRSHSMENARTTARRTQRLNLAIQLAYPFIESFAAMVRHHATADSESWAQLPRGLQDCVRLALALEEGEESNHGPTTDKQKKTAAFVLLSNAYWHRYLQDNHGAKEGQAARDCLRTAVDLLKDRPVGEKIDGCLMTKLEKYGHNFESTKEYTKAIRAYALALEVAVDTDVVGEAASIAGSNSIPLMVIGQPEVMRLSRVLLAYPRVAFKIAEQDNAPQITFDSERIDAAKRGLMLEQQLISILTIAQCQAAAKTAYSALNSIAQKLLGLYTENTFPVRRLRVAVRLLNFVSTHPGSLDIDVHTELMKEPQNVSGHIHMDAGLLETLPHLIGSRTIAIEVSQEGMRVEILEQVLVSWFSMLHNCPTWDSLQSQVYDTSEWIIQLEMIAEYLDMQGLDLARVSVLHLLASITEISNKESSKLASRLSELGSLYTRLGYCGAAAVSLRKAQGLVKASGVATNIALAWYLSSAENAIASRNPRAWYVSAFCDTIRSCQTNIILVERASTRRRVCSTLAQAETHLQRLPLKAAFAFANA